MKRASKALHILEKIIAVVLFLLMLINCGRYIDIKINGRAKSYALMPENDKRILLQIGAGAFPSKGVELIKPIFAGFKSSVGAYAADFSDTSRQAVSDISNEYIPLLFSGTYEKAVFESDEEKAEYIEELKNAEEYILFSYYSDIPAAAFLAGMSGYSENTSNAMYFNVQNLFILPNEDQKAYGIAVSSSLDINILTAQAHLPFNSKELEAYNSSTGFTAFEFADSSHIVPVFCNTLKTNCYSIETSAVKFGMQDNTEWVKKTLNAFEINQNLAKTFVNRDGTVLNYVDGENELLFYQNGNTVYNTSGKGVSLSSLLGYGADGGRDYSFSEKITAVKTIINKMYNAALGNNASLVLVSVRYDEAGDILTLGLKYFANGIAVTDDVVDASFRVMGNNLVYSRFNALCCTKLGNEVHIMPQRYAVVLGDGEPVASYAVLEQSDVEQSNAFSAQWFMRNTTSDKE